MSDLHAIGDRLSVLWEPLGASAAYRLVRSTAERSGAIARRGDAPFEVGSCFKAFVAAECCRQVSEGLLTWDDPLHLDPERRVPASARSEDWPDGSTVTLDEAARAMIAVSDNTATDMVMDRIGHAPVVVLIGRLGLTNTVIPRRVRVVYARAEDVRPIACESTMRDLARFYAAVLSPDSPLDERARSDFRRLMRQEDLEQGSTWPEGVECYRKSGSLEPPPMFAMAMAGAFAADHYQAEFAFAVNIETSDDTAMADAASVFIEGVTIGMKALAASES
jgi:CubicO group peptidase (beta-lactamase class C family)